MLLIYLHIACQSNTVTQERDSVVLNEQQRYGTRQTEGKI